MYFLLFIFVFIAFAYLNGRINTLERLFRSNYSPRPSPVEAQNAAQQQSQAPQQATVTAQPAQSAIPVAPGFTPPTTPKVSGEELSGQWLGRVGVFAVFAGVASFLQYAFSNNLIGPAGRIAIGFIISIAFLVLGGALVKKYRWYASLLSGAGIAILYVTIACAHVFYHFIPASVALGLMLATTAVSVFLSLKISVKTLATVGIVGGFLTPLFVDFASSPSDLLVYYVLFNIGILAVSYTKRWPALTVISFIGTALSVFRWIAMYYNESQYLWTLVSFITIYFIIFLASTLTHHIVRREESSAGDVVMVAVNGLGYFAICWSLMTVTYHDLMGYFALAMAALYFAIGYLCHIYNARNVALNIALPALGVIFVSIAIPLHFDAHWITLTWILEAVTLYTISFKIRNPQLQILGAGVFGVGALHALTAETAPVAFFNVPFAISVVCIVAAYYIAYLYRTYPDRVRTADSVAHAVGAFVTYATVFTIYAVTVEIGTLLAGNSNQLNAAVSIFWAVYAIALMALGISHRARMLRVLSLALFALTALRIFVDLWALGEIYRIVTFIVFGAIALIGSFAYSKYKDRIRDLV
jgi:uncharacterized membrane protein